MNFIIKGLSVYEETETISNGEVYVKNGKIEYVGKVGSGTDLPKDVPVYDFSSVNYSLVPGFIDIHIHGANGADVMDGNIEGLPTMASILPQEGTTSFLATTITQSEAEISGALKNAAQYMIDQPSGLAELIGIHLEGPFITPSKAGAQPIQHIISSSISLFNQWQEDAGGNIKIMTMAPEQDGGLELVEHASNEGVIVSIGHTDALFTTVEKAVRQGASHVTHLYNQMRGLHHREPGVVGAALSIDNLFVELICDGIHVHPQVVKATYNAKGADKLFIVTDSMRAKWLEDGVYDLGGQEVTVANNTALLQDGTLAGSVLKMDEAVRNMMTFTGCSLRDAIKMASENQAKRLGIYEQKGSIRVGKDADLVILDEQNEVWMTFCRGTLSYERGGETVEGHSL